jgi:hypothetical protein
VAGATRSRPNGRCCGARLRAGRYDRLRQRPQQYKKHQAPFPAPDAPNQTTRPTPQQEGSGQL